MSICVLNLRKSGPFQPGIGWSGAVHISEQPESLSFTGNDNRADQFSYNADGDVTTGLSNSYLYDAEGRVCAVDSTINGVTLYLYNAAGERVAKGTGSFSCDMATNGFTLTHRYVLDLAGRQMTEYDGSTWAHTNVFADGQLLATYSSTGTPLTFALSDWLGTKRVQAKADGELDMSFLSLPYGDQLANGTGATEQFFTGKVRDAESGNDYFGARYYASSMGRFMSPDPSGLTFASAANPQSLNLYSYALNNPLEFIDPTGRYCFYGGNGETIHNDSNSSDYNFTISEKGCKKGHGKWIDNPSTTVTVSGGGNNGNTLSTFPSDVSLNYQFVPGSGCSAALSIAGQRPVSIDDYYNYYGSEIGEAAAAHGINARLLAAVGIRESGLPRNPNVIQAGGMGRGLFQIDLGQHPGVTIAQAFNPNYSANFAANMLSANMATLALQHPNLNAAQLIQATAASYNFGTKNISGNPNTIDVGTAENDYGANVVAIANDCF